MALLTVGVTDTLITAKAEVSYSDRELGAEGEGTLPSEHICFIISVFALQYGTWDFSGDAVACKGLIFR